LFYRVNSFEPHSLGNGEREAVQTLDDEGTDKIPGPDYCAKHIGQPDSVPLHEKTKGYLSGVRYRENTYVGILL
jgi:hypothetical protein